MKKNRKVRHKSPHMIILTISEVPLIILMWNPVKVATLGNKAMKAPFHNGLKIVLTDLNF